MSLAEDGAAPQVQLFIDRTAVPSRVAVEAFEDGGECLLYNPIRDEASALNRTASEVWHQCDGSLTILDISRVLGERYGVDGTLLIDDVARAIDALRTRGLIVVPEDRLPGPT
jgi:Coenzyme PQQ synthesis protein D (PqqD)